MLTDEAHAGDRPLDGHRFHILTQSLLQADGVADVLALVEAAARELIPGADAVGVTMRQKDGGYTFPIDVDDAARALDRVQYEAGCGPCVEVSEPDGPAYVACPDLATAASWPALAAAATERGYPAMVAVGVKAAATAGARQVTGAISGYARRRHALDEPPARDAVLLLGTHASLALTAVRTADLGRREAANLRAALRNRDVIGQAKGVLMERYGLTPRHAFDALSAASQHLNIKLAELAAVIAAGVPDGNPDGNSGGNSGGTRTRQRPERAADSPPPAAAAGARADAQRDRDAPKQSAQRLVPLATAAYQRGLRARRRALAVAPADGTASGRAEPEAPASERVSE